MKKLILSIIVIAIVAEIGTIVLYKKTHPQRFGAFVTTPIPNNIGGQVSVIGNSTGIGTTTPWGQLSINPTATLTGTGPEFVVGSSTATTFIVGNNQIVGIATTTPQGTASLTGAVLDINGGVHLETLNATNGIFTDWTNSQFHFIHTPFQTGASYDLGLDVDPSIRALYIYAKAADNTSNIQFQTGATPSTRVMINQFGYVGIGTTTPIVELQVATTTVNATSTLEVGKANQNKGSCFKLWRSDGTAIFAYVAAGTTAFTLSTIQCN